MIHNLNSTIAQNDGDHQLKCYRAACVTAPEFALQAVDLTVHGVGGLGGVLQLTL